MDRRAFELRRRSFLGALTVGVVGTLLRRTGREDLSLGRVVLAGDDGPLFLAPPGFAETSVLLELTDGAGSELLVSEDSSVIALRLDPQDSRAFVEDRSLVEPVEAARRITFVGGDPPAWAACLYSRGRSLLLASIERAFARGATVAARGRAAASLGALAIVGQEEWSDEERNPRRAGRYTLWTGPGFFPFAAVEVGRGASPERLVRAMASERLRTGAYLEPASALRADLETGSIRVAGEGAVLWLDFRGARRLGRSVRGARISLLLAGDRVDGERGAIHLGRAAVPVRSSRGAQERRVADVLEVGVLRDALAEFAQDGPARILIRDDSRAITLRPGDETLTAIRPGETRRSLSGIVLDLEGIS